MRIGRYEDRGRGGATKGRTHSPETRHKISEGVIRNNKTRQIYQVTHKRADINKLHGDKFFIAFDEFYGILYIDLKMISGACGMMK